METNERNEEKGDEAAIDSALEALRALRARLGIEPAEGAQARVQIRNEGIVPEGLVEVASEVGEEHSNLVGAHFDAAGFEAARLRLRAIEPLRDLVLAFARELDDHLLRQQAKVGHESRMLYKYMRAIAPTPRGKAILEPLDRMTKAMRKPRKKPPAESGQPE